MDLAIYLLVFIGVLTACGTVSGRLATLSGRPFWVWFAAGLMLGPLAWMLAGLLLLLDRRSPKERTEQENG